MRFIQGGRCIFQNKELKGKHGLAFLVFSCIFATIKSINNKLEDGFN